MNTNTEPNLTKVNIGGKSVLAAQVIVCPVTGQLLLRTAGYATESGLKPEMYAAKEITAPKSDGVAPAGPATLVHPDVDPKTLR